MKRIISALAALTLVFGAAALPVDRSVFETSMSASASSITDYDYEVLPDGTVRITKCTGGNYTQRIPAEIDGRIVTTIGMSAFEG